MSQDIVVRRFEVHAPGQGTLDEVALALREAADKLPTEQVKAKIDKVERPPMLIVRLQGVASAIATVRDSVSRVHGAQVRREWLDVPAAMPHAGAVRAAGSVSREDHDVHPDQRALLRIDPEGRSRRETGSGEPFVVAVVDSGIMVDHPDLKDHLWTMEDRRDVHGARCMGGAQDYDLTDQDGHGTMLAGSILATANAVRGLELMAVKFFDVITQPVAANAAQAIHFAAEHGAKIINLSFDLGIGSNDLRQAIQNACKGGALVVIAAGNTGSNNDHYPIVPACYAKVCLPDSVIVVMATNEYDEKPTLSNFGSETVDLAAPGVKIETTRTFRSTGGEVNKYGRYTGTSAAAAQVTGAAALLKSQNPTWEAKNIKSCLMESADKLPGLKCVSRGRLNLGRALSYKP
jgi:subtilisin family serine protease